MKKRKKIVIIGGGLSVEEIYPILKRIKKENYIIKSIYDDNKNYHKKYYYDIPFKVGIENARENKNCLFVFAIGSYKNKKK